MYTVPTNTLLDLELELELELKLELELEVGERARMGTGPWAKGGECRMQQSWIRDTSVHLTQAADVPLGRKQT